MQNIQNNIRNLDINFFACFTVLGLICCLFLLFVTSLHVMECVKGRKESGYEEMMEVSGLASFVMFIFSVIAWAS